MTKLRPWSAAELARLRALYPVMATRLIKIRGRTSAQIHSQAGNLHLRKSAAFLASDAARKPWTPKQLDLLCKLYPYTKTEHLAISLDHKLSSVYARASVLGLKKTDAFLASTNSGRLSRLCGAGVEFRFKPGHVPANKGVKGWQAGGRSRETQFKPGKVSPRWHEDDYQLGQLRLNKDGYVDIKMRQGLRGWDKFHRVFWEDAHGPVPRGHCVVFRNGDTLDIGLDNLELITREELMRRNSVHNLPAPLKSAIQLLGQLKRRIREKQDRRSA